VVSRPFSSTAALRLEIVTQRAYISTIVNTPTRYMEPGASVDLPEPETIREAVLASRFAPTALEVLARFEELQTQNSVLAQEFWRKNQEAIRTGFAARQHQVIIDAAEKNRPEQAFPRGSIAAKMEEISDPRARQVFYLRNKEIIHQAASRKIDEAIHLKANRRQSLVNLATLPINVQST